MRTPLLQTGGAGGQAWRRRKPHVEGVASAQRRRKSPRRGATRITAITTAASTSTPTRNCITRSFIVPLPARARARNTHRLRHSRRSRPLCWYYTRVARARSPPHGHSWPFPRSGSRAGIYPGSTRRDKSSFLREYPLSARFIGLLLQLGDSLQPIVHAPADGARAGWGYIVII